MTRPRRARAEVRQRFDADAWRQLVEDDLDENDSEHAALSKEIADIKRYLLGILVSTTTAALLLAANLALGK